MKNLLRGITLGMLMLLCIGQVNGQSLGYEYEYLMKSEESGFSFQDGNELVESNGVLFYQEDDGHINRVRWDNWYWKDEQLHASGTSDLSSGFAVTQYGVFYISGTSIKRINHTSSNKTPVTVYTDSNISPTKLVGDGTKIYLVVGSILKELTWNGSVLQGTKAYSNSTPNAGTEIAINSSSIYYIGTDSKIHYNNRLTTSIYGTIGSLTVDTNTDLVATSNHIYFYDSNGYPYNYYTSNGSTWTASKLISSSSVKAISGSQIVHSESSLIFADTDGYIREFYYNGSSWVDGGKPAGTWSNTCSSVPGLVLLNDKICFTSIAEIDPGYVEGIRYITDTEVMPNSVSRGIYAYNSSASTSFSSVDIFTAITNYTRTHSGGTYIPEQAYYSDHVSYSNGELVIWGEKTTYSATVNTPTGDVSSTFYFKSGEVRTADYYNDGYFEIRASLPYGERTWPSFWLFRGQGEYYREIDIFEHFGVDEKFSEPSTNTWTAANQQSGGVRSKIWNASEYHIYGLKKVGGILTWYIDHAPVKTLDTGTTMDYLRVYLNMAMDHCWNGNGSSTDRSPAPDDCYYKIDYFRYFGNEVEEDVSGTPDYTIQSVSLSTNPVTVGENTTVTTQIKNIGPTTSSSSTAYYYLSSDTRYDTSDDYLGASSSIPGLGAFQTYSIVKTVTIDSQTQSGNYYILVRIDEGFDSTYEVNDDGNVGVTVQDPPTDIPDLIFTASTISPSTLNAGQLFFYSCTIKNDGPEAVGQTTDLRLYLSNNTILDGNDVALGSIISTSNLAAGSSEVKTSRMTIPNPLNDSYTYILFVADDGEDVTEISEVNNISAVAVSVGVALPPPPGQPDLDVHKFQNSLLCYPSPTNSEFTVEFKYNRKVNAVIKDCFGKTVLNKTIGSGEVVSLNQKPGGIYYILIYGENGKFFGGKMILKK